ncbi:hypothetical protein WOLCODRAFT_133859 [Wolfiporia cocos MD-104 SS10]|uniref:Protein UNC80 C-terminal domain-containing protein n=1 Tax=Wolfiporia cocos (strain MD-104) TaxID=742152 RepID=A0A2H3J6M4_WOLCO|nr:hypothetical protein WOLCODRAFT_133859 [Wolfiporia cocos MD-104 SS10]
MAMRRDGSKKSSSGRPLPKRLFSLDTLRKQRSGSDSDTSSIASKETAMHTRAPSTDSTTSTFRASTLKGEEKETATTNEVTPWTEQEMVQSPDQLKEQVDPDTTAKIAAPKPRPLNLSAEGEGSKEEAPPLSPGRQRWATLRSHVLPSAGGSTAPVPLRSGTARTTTPGQGTPPPTRPATPTRPYRFGQKKIFRQVVEAAVDEHRKFSEEILSACWCARFGELSSRPRPEREGSQATIGSSLHLPFMTSAAALPMVASPSISSIRTMRRPESSHTLAMDPRGVPSVGPLHRVMTFSNPATRPHSLPHEAHVLSALLVPFLGAYSGGSVASEQQTAVETFEQILRTWKAPSNEANLERCLWCCNAASVPSSSRIRILGALSSILFSREKSFDAESPRILRTLYTGMFSLLMCLSSSPDAQSEAESLRAYVFAVLDGQCGSPASESFEKEYGVSWSSDDNAAHVRRVIAAESVISCLETGSEDSRKWVLRNLLEEFWPASGTGQALTPLLSRMRSCKLKAFVSAASILLFSAASSNLTTRAADAAVIGRLLNTRVLPMIELLEGKDAAELRTHAVRLVLDLTCVHDLAEREQYIAHVDHWMQDQPAWKPSLEECLRNTLSAAEWPTILRLLPIMSRDYPEELRKTIATLSLPLLHDRLMSDPPEYPCHPLSEYLDLVSRMHPQLFFKPLFTCAASGKELTIANQICILNCIAKYLPDFWCRDAGMMSVALISDLGGAKQQPAPQGEGPVWGRARLGQSVLLVELTQFLRSVREAKDIAVTAQAVRFSVALETKLAALIQAKEQTALVPLSQRVLFCNLFKEIRTLTRSLKSAPWLSSVINWLLREASLSESDPELDTSLNSLRTVYSQASSALQGGNKRRTTVFASPVNVQRSQSLSDHPANALLAARLQFIEDIDQPLRCIACPLLVLVSGLLHPEHYSALGRALLEHCLDRGPSRNNAPTIFLLMQYAEKVPNEFLQRIQGGLLNENPVVRLLTIDRLATIASWRFQISSQDFIMDRAYRRPFKPARAPVQFVPTDMGTSSHVLDEDVYEFKDSNGHVLPLELRRRLAEIGWDQEDRVIDPKTQWIKTPLSLIPSLSLDVLDTSTDDPSLSESPNLSPEHSPTSSPSNDSLLLRRDSTSGSSRGAKRRPVFVPTLQSLFPILVDMVKDPDFLVASSVKSLVVDFMRDDPSLLSRSIFHSMSGSEDKVISSITAVASLMHTQYPLPPAMSHHLLNHLAGFLKSTVRQADGANPLQSYAYTAPAIARLVTQVSKMSVREIRRAKVDAFLLPTGALWFPDTAPLGPMFPRALEESENPFESIPAPLVWITLVRTSQNLLFHRMLERDPQELKIIRKSITRLALPSKGRSEDGGFLPSAAFMPRKRNVSMHSASDMGLTALSLTLARSHLLLVSQMFWSMSRHLSDRQELAILMDGLNRVLLTHGDDIGIVGHAMLAFMLASTRFKRMFISGGAYALFMPAIIKVYSEADGHPGIRTAIEYAVNRFYTLHQESFVFQSFDVVSHMLISPDVDQAWLAGHVFSLFSTLKNGTAPLAPDVAGIYDLNKLQEQENRMAAVAEEVPQTFLASLRRGGSGKNQVTLVLPEEYEWRRLELDNLVRLFLTVIAHNPGIQRAERFLRALRLLTPHFYNTSNSARSVLRDGIDALGSILSSKTATKAKPSDSTTGRAPDDFSYDVLADGSGHEPQQALSPGDLLAMRLDYLSLVIAYVQAGGRLGQAAPRRVLELIKLVLKESITSADRVALFLSDYSRAILLCEPAPTLKDVVSLLSDLFPIVNEHCTSVNFSGVYDVLVKLSNNNVFANQQEFADLIVVRFCRTGLDACRTAASESWLLSFPSRMSVIALLNNAIPLVPTGSDVIDELVDQPPSYEFLAGVILPMVLSMKTTSDIASGHQWTDSWRHESHSKAWIRLLSYILSACQRTHSSYDSSKPPERRKSQDGRIPSYKSAMTMSIAMQILKLIVIRAERDLSSAMPTVWTYIGDALRTVLADGDASFALKPQDSSEPPSPLQSPRSPTLTTDQGGNTFLQSKASLSSLNQLAQPRLIDYLIWSIIQWLCLRKNPLCIQMRGFIQEKVANVYYDSSQLGRSSNISSGVKSRRLSSAFTKPRRSMLNTSAASSAASTPRNSVLISNSSSLPTFDENGLLASTPRKVEAPRLAGYARESSPVSPSGRMGRSTGPQIVHLGPVVPLSVDVNARRSVSPGGTRISGSALAMARQMMITTPALIRMTYRRIRLAQVMCGYTTLLPLSEGTEDLDTEDVAVRSWTKKEAIEAVLQEVKDLMDEFRGMNTDANEGDGILVDAEVPASPSKW